MHSPNPEHLIGRLNFLWSELIQAYTAKEKLPLANLDAPFYFISADWKQQKVELHNHFEQWRGQVTKENLAALDAARAEIAGLNKQLNRLLSRLCLAGFTIVSFDDLTPEDLLLFSEEARNLSSTLKEIKAQKLILIQQKKLEEVARLHFKEKALLASIMESFAQDHPGLYFKDSWYKEKELLFLPSGKFEMKVLIKRLTRSTYKNN